MTTPRPAPDILAERMQVVLAIGEANAAIHKAQAVVGGVQIDVMNVEEQLEAGGPTPDLNATLDAVYDRDDAARAELAVAQAKLVALEDKLAELDRELAAASS
jgi:hypothetical protein